MHAAEAMAVARALGVHLQGQRAGDRRRPGARPPASRAGPRCSRISSPGGRSRSTRFPVRSSAWAHNAACPPRSIPWRAAPPGDAQGRRAIKRFLLVILSFAYVHRGLRASLAFKPVRIVVAYPPGGGIDVMGRQLAREAHGRLGPAGGGRKPARRQHHPGDRHGGEDAPDGYTILMTTDATFFINPHLYAKLPFDTQQTLSR